MRLNRSLLVIFVSVITLFSFAVPNFSAHTSIQYELSEVRTVAGNQNADLKNGDLINARFDTPSKFVKLRNGNIVIADTNNHVIRQINDKKVISLAGSPFLIDGDIAYQGSFLDGRNLEAAFNEPAGLAIANDGTIIIADSANHAIRKITTDGNVTTIAGNGVLGLEDGDGKSARFNSPHDIAIDSKGNIYVADALNHVIRKISKNGKVSTVTKPSKRIVEYTQGLPDFAGDFADGTIKDALFNEPSALLIDQKDNLYVADRGNQRIRYIDFSKNTVSTVAGSGDLLTDEYYVEGGNTDGPATKAQFSSPEGMALIDKSTLLIADRKNHTIRQLKDGIVSTITGTAEQFGNKDGLLQSALFNEPVDVLVQGDGTLLILEAGNNQIRKLATYDAFLSQKYSKKAEVWLNGKLLETTVEFIQSEPLLPLNTIGEELDLAVNYEKKSGEITLSNEKTTFYFMKIRRLHKKKN
ncbi:NHL repeat-containing protein [Solibacillus merdavium]|uniref:Copper amine oxidase n=1 Tax=Solibacillus merdavium TaxID=2762218 RepID=A0ABR8XQY2_9BACL|nr:copper amine oxidase [Solibacillus merdavium]MBD8034284.1 copper amine oxidase [Solibacillus merdavium]